MQHKTFKQVSGRRRSVGLSLLDGKKVHKCGWSDTFAAHKSNKWAGRGPLGPVIVEVRECVRPKVLSRTKKVPLYV